MNIFQNPFQHVKSGVSTARSLLRHLRDKLLMAAVNERVDALQGELRGLTNHVLLATAHNLVMRGDHRHVPAFDVQAASNARPRKLRIGLFDNLANQAYITARAMRRLGHDVDVVIQESWADIFAYSRPQWEECEIEDIDPWKFDAVKYEWTPPNYVRYVPYNAENSARYIYRVDAAAEVAALYKEHFGKNLSNDIALLLAQYMAHWDYIRAMGNYDVVMLSMSAAVLGVFSPKPTVLCPLGSEVYTRAFDQDVGGLLCRAAFRQAAHLSVCETDYFAYLDRMGANGPRSFMPLIVDTDIYAPGEEPGLRVEWRGKIGGERFLLGVCRQDWDWKGSDKLIRAFARFHRAPEGRDWRLLLQSWGTDIERSRALVAELGLDNITLWLTMCSKPLLRRRQRAADAVADQFVMEGYGASVLESLAAAKPVIVRPVPEASKHHFRVGPPPFVGATTEEDIVAALEALSDDAERGRIGMASRDWVEKEHGYKNLAPLYMQMFEQAALWGGERRQ